MSTKRLLVRAACVISSGLFGLLLASHLQMSVEAVCPDGLWRVRAFHWMRVLSVWALFSGTVLPLDTLVNWLWKRKGW